MKGRGTVYLGAPFVFVRKGSGSREGVGSVTVGEVDPAGLTRVPLNRITALMLSGPTS